jgi:asparagine synthetase B (glutamine-hydrolysing)
MAQTVPADIVARRKHGLGAPNRGWWRRELPEFAVHALSRESLRAAGYFQPDAVERMLDLHRKGGGWASQLSAVLALQLKFAQGMVS